MAISEDTSNQPAPVQFTGTWTTPGITTASFSPGANTLLVALVAADGTGASQVTAAVTDSVGGSTGWAMLARSNGQNGTVGGTSEVWVKWLSGAPGSMTVNVTGTGGTSTGGLLVVRSLLGASSTQNGAVGTQFNTTSVALSVSVAAGTGNMIYGAILDFVTNATLAMLANTVAIDNFADATNGDTWWAGKSTGTTAGTATYGSSTTATGQVAFAEILAGGGTDATVTFPQSVSIHP